MAVEIRAAEVDEVEAIVPLYEWLFASPGSVPSVWDPKRAAVALRGAIESHDAVVLVADEHKHSARLLGSASGGGRVSSETALVGFLTAYQDLHSVRYGYRAWVEDLAVDPDRRSEGIGKALLDAAKAWAKERGAIHLELDSAEARADAHRFYEREGADYRAISFGWEL